MRLEHRIINFRAGTVYNGVMTVHLAGLGVPANG